MAKFVERYVRQTDKLYWLPMLLISGCSLLLKTISVGMKYQSAKTKMSIEYEEQNEKQK